MISPYLSDEVFEQMKNAYKDALEEDSPVWEALRDLADMSIKAEVKDLEAAKAWVPKIKYDPFAEFIDAEKYDELIAKLDKEEPSWDFSVRLEGATPARRKAYGRTVLRNACDRVRVREPGDRSDYLVGQAFLVGTFVPHFLNPQQAADALFEAALESGLDRLSVKGTVRRGMEAGMKKPKRELPASPQMRAEFDWNDIKRFRD